MIDLHSHILPGIDDGAPDLEASMEIARRSVADGISLMVATPHVNGRYMPGPDLILERVKRLNEALHAESLPLVVSPGAEIAVSELGNLDDATLGRLALGGSRTLLVESPYVDGVPYFDQILFGVQSRGFRVLLAHPERSPMFRSGTEVLEGLTKRGVLSSITAGSLRGRFGRKVQRTAEDLLRAGLVHNVSSDTHDVRNRPPGLSSGFTGQGVLPGVVALAPWLTEAVPHAILRNTELPTMPALLDEVTPRRDWSLARLTRRSR